MGMDYVDHMVRRTDWFRDLTEEEYREALKHMNAHVACFQAGQTIKKAGDRFSAAGLLLEGKARYERKDWTGGITPLGSIRKGGSFNEIYAAKWHAIEHLDIIAEEDCEVLFLYIHTVLYPRQDNTNWRQKVLKNLYLNAIEENQKMLTKILCTGSHTARGRIAAFLQEEATRNHSNTFRLSMSRKGMAEFLNLDRSALSRELMKMKQEGLLEYHRNQFTLHPLS